MKKVIFALAGIVMSCALLAGNSFAETWAACTPSQIGPQGSIVRLKVSACNIAPDNSHDGYLTLSTTGTDQMMAVVLTAMSLSKPIAVKVDGSVDAEGYNIATAVILSVE